MILGLLLSSEDMTASDSLQIVGTESSVDSEILQTRLSLFSQIHPKLLPIGFYSTCQVSEDIIRILSTALNKSEMYWLCFDGSDLQVCKYQVTESKISVTQVSHCVRGTEPTTIALRDVWNTSAGKDDISRRCVESIKGLGMSYETLLSKMSILQKYVDNVATGKRTADPEILLEISSLINEFNSGLLDKTTVHEEEEEVARAVIRLAKATDAFERVVEKGRPGNNK